MRFSSTKVRYDRPPPRLGEHTREVLTEVLGLEEPALRDLAARGVISLP
jgi:formyl-CoA transferase